MTLHRFRFQAFWRVVPLFIGVFSLAGCRPAEPSSSVASSGEPTSSPNGNSPGDKGNGKASTNDAPPGLYGTQGDETVLAADPSLPDSILRCRAIDTFYKLSNPHLGATQFGRPVLMVNYEKVKLGEQDGFTVEIQAGDGSHHTVLMLGPSNQTRGTLEIPPWSQGFGPPSFPKTLEVYLTHADNRYGPQNPPVFKVSNSVTMGTLPKMTLPRNWTKEEIARLGKPPPDYANPNAHSEVGVDSSFAGDPTFAAFPQRFVEPGGILLGLEYRPGDWMGEKGLAQVVPVFNRNQPDTLPQRVLGKEGYAVGGIKVQSKRFVDAAQIIFMRVGKDGQLDPADSYTSEWLGNQTQETPKTLDGGGKRVIGLHCRQGAVIFALALILDRDGGNKP